MKDFTRNGSRTRRPHKKKRGAARRGTVRGLKPCIDTSRDDVASVAAPTPPAFKSKFHGTLYQMIHADPAVSENPTAQRLIDALLGAAGASNDLNEASLLQMEKISMDVNRRIRLEMTDKEMEVCHLRIQVPGSSIGWHDCSFELAKIGKHGRDLKQLACNTEWRLVPMINVSDEGEGIVDYALEGILFEPNLCSNIDQRLREPIFRLTQAGKPEPIVVTKLDRDETAIRQAVKGLFCIMPAHLPRSMCPEMRQRAALRLLQVRASMETKQLARWDMGEGKVHMGAALTKARKDLPTGQAAATSAAPKARRARDIAWLMRLTGFNDFELPYLKR